MSGLYVCTYNAWPPRSQNDGWGHIEFDRIYGLPCSRIITLSWLFAGSIITCDNNLKLKNFEHHLVLYRDMVIVRTKCGKRTIYDTTNIMKIQGVKVAIAACKYCKTHDITTEVT